MTSFTKRTIQRTNRFVRDLKSLPDNIIHEAFRISQVLSSDIFDQQLDVHELVGFKGFYRVIVAKHYRLIFSFDKDNIFLLRIAHRKDIYRKLEL
jgi:addiction module RelE/StbE family toxin